MTQNIATAIENDLKHKSVILDERMAPRERTSAGRGDYPVISQKYFEILLC
jgi:hypothetical protein